ncbi:MAG: replication factor A [Candidatus Methanoperedens sp.]|jgi:replication factor A1|nr:replication factor A [Candidatus Methanoperedens sp.]PKL54521.1 MAG: replication factor A [Candidatus Methanoperedenaceae archaeon HGW-Methanoperedenaceae-1]
MKEIATQIEARFAELGIKVEPKDIETRLNQLIHEFKVPAEEARRNVINYFLKEYDIPRTEFYTPRETQPVKASEINEDGKWITLRAKVVQLWESNHESISQVGLLGDESGTIKFTKWAKAELPDIEEGKCYLFKNITTSEWQGQFSVKFNKTSEITPIDEDIEVGSTPVEFRGALVDIQSGSGLIKRCPECNRALVKGACGEHGKVDGVYDLRVKAVMDNGEKVQDILLNREVTENLTGITLDEAKDMATEALDQSVVLDAIKNKLVGRYFIVTGAKLDRFILVESIKPDEDPVDEDITMLLASAAQAGTAAQEA